MLQTNLTLSPELTYFERHQAIRQAVHNDRTQMTLMRAHRVRVAEVEILRALEGDTAHELDFSRWEDIIQAFESLSFEFFHKRGSAAFKVFLNFGGYDPSPELRQKYQGLIEQFIRAD